ncbi:transposase, partial [Mesorhizobium sp.]|uniref:transposase n=1 Tax=Mesorhizobium sp. TaxID=1871066 RepID=UPI000FE528BB
IPVTNMLERLNQEIKRRTLVVRIFPNPQSCLRLVRALVSHCLTKLVTDRLHCLT